LSYISEDMGQAHTRTAGSVSTVVKDTAPIIHENEECPHFQFTQSALLKNNDPGTKKP